MDKHLNEMNREELEFAALTVENRNIARACQQAVYAMDAAALGDMKRAEQHAYAARRAWLQGHACDADQTRSASEKCEKLYQEGVGSKFEGFLGRKYKKIPLITGLTNLFGGGK